MRRTNQGGRLRTLLTSSSAQTTHSRSKLKWETVDTLWCLAMESTRMTLTTGKHWTNHSRQSSTPTCWRSSWRETSASSTHARYQWLRPNRTSLKPHVQLLTFGSVTIMSGTTSSRMSARLSIPRPYMMTLRRSETKFRRAWARKRDESLFLMFGAFSSCHMSDVPKCRVPKEKVVSEFIRDTLVHRSTFKESTLRRKHKTAVINISI